MIFDSTTWKIELNRDLQVVKRRLQKAKFLDEHRKYQITAITIEKFSFTSAFILRKLIESKKFSDEFESTPIQVRFFKRTNQDNKLQLFNRYHIDRFYDLENATATTLSIPNVCNAFIHSYVFEIAFGDGENSVDGLFFNSDKTKEKGVFFIQVDNYFEVIERAIKDEILQIHVTQNDVMLKSRKQHKP